MFTLFKKQRIIPYYLFHNDQREMAQSFTVPPQQEIYIYGQLWKYVSGLVDTVRLVFDNGNGKIIAPISAFSINWEEFTDMRGNIVHLPNA